MNSPDVSSNLLSSDGSTHAQHIIGDKHNDAESRLCRSFVAQCGAGAWRLRDAHGYGYDTAVAAGIGTAGRVLAVKGRLSIAGVAAACRGADLLVLVAISGGGKRSSSFGYGALKGMRETAVPAAAGPVSLLSQVGGISGVSGGSFPAAYYGLYRDGTFGRFEQDFLYDDTNSYIYGVYFLPWNWTWMADPSFGTNDFMAQVYDKTMFHGATFRDLAARGRPLIAVGATDISYGAPWLFTQENFDLICANLEDFPLARAVAASNGFPGLFSPVTLTNRTADCGGRKPGWLAYVTPAQKNNPLSQVGRFARNADRYLDPQQTAYVHLVDGGVSDNLALRAAGSLMLVSTTDIAATPLANARRIPVISVDGEGGQDTSVARRKDVGGLFALLGLVTGNQIDSYNFDTLILLNSTAARITGGDRQGSLRPGAGRGRRPVRRRAGQTGSRVIVGHASRA